MKYLNKSFSVGGPLAISQEDWDRIFKPTSLADLGADYDRPFLFPVELRGILDGTSGLTGSGLDGFTECGPMTAPEVVRPPRRGRKTNWPGVVVNVRGRSVTVYRCIAPESYREWDSDEWDVKSDASFIEKNGVRAVYYWYASGSYEGAGWALFVCGNGDLVLGSLFHCSCGDPNTDGTESLSRFSDIKELRAWSSAEIREQVGPLLARMKK